MLISAFLIDAEKLMGFKSEGDAVSGISYISDSAKNGVDCISIFNSYSPNHKSIGKFENMFSSDIMGNRELRSLANLSIPELEIIKLIS